MIYASKKELYNTMRKQLERKDVAEKALLRIYDNQTADEKSSASVKYYNNVGFTCIDANILTGFAKQLKYKGFLSAKQHNILVRLMPKYAKQLVDGSLIEGKIYEHNGKYYTHNDANIMRDSVRLLENINNI